MPTLDITRIDPIDAQGNVIIGVALPFGKFDYSLPNPIISGSYAIGDGVFNNTYSTKDQIKSNLINLLLTAKGERPFNPEFGCDLKKSIFEGITNDLTDIVELLVSDAIKKFIPEIILSGVTVTSDNPDTNTITVTIKYRLLVSKATDQITLEFV